MDKVQKHNSFNTALHSSAVKVQEDLQL